MSRNFAKIKKFFDEDLWSKERVRLAVEKGMITAEEYKLITKEDYE